MNHTTSFASIRVITSDVSGLVGFYEQVTGAPAAWATPQFAEIRTSAGTLAVAGTATLAVFGPDIAEPGANRTVIIEFLVADVDSEYLRLNGGLELDLVQEPTTMPWGNRSLLFRDPDGNLVNLFTPLTPEAIERVRASVGPAQG
jgi:catechol 2,3-dioxygenase-like lactoylglutathione lyase family enzyme